MWPCWLFWPCHVVQWVFQQSCCSWQELYTPDFPDYYYYNITNVVVVIILLHYYITTTTTTTTTDYKVPASYFNVGLCQDSRHKRHTQCAVNEVGNGNRCFYRSSLLGYNHTRFRWLTLKASSSFCVHQTYRRVKRFKPRLQHQLFDNNKFITHLSQFQWRH